MFIVSRIFFCFANLISAYVTSHARVVFDRLATPYIEIHVNGLPVSVEPIRQRECVAEHLQYTPVVTIVTQPQPGTSVYAHR